MRIPSKNIGLFASLIGIALLSACATATRQTSDTSESSGGAGGVALGNGGQGGSGGDLGLGGMGAGSPGEGIVYVNSLDKLYKFETQTSKLSEIGVFDCVVSDPSGSSDSGMHDIAIDKDGLMFGVAKVGAQSPNQPQKQDHVIVSVDPKTGSCQKVLTIPVGIIDPNGSIEVRGLSFVPVGTLNPNQETLVALELSGNYLKIDLAAKSVVLVGDLNGNGPATWTTKGADIVSLVLDKTYVTAKAGGAEERLAVMDPKTGAITTDIGPIAILTMGGLAYWAGTLYGFSVEGTAYAIDPLTGAATSIAVSGAPAGIQYHGAGVTTVAPIEPPK